MREFGPKQPSGRDSIHGAEPDPDRRMSPGAIDVLRHLWAIHHGQEDLEALQETAFQCQPRDVPDILTGAGQILRSRNFSSAAMVTAAVIELIDSIPHGKEFLDELQRLGQMALEVAEELGDDELMCKAHLHCAHLATTGEDQDPQEALHHYVRGLVLLEKSFGPFAGERALKFLPEYCALAELQQNALDFEGANESADKIIAILEQNKSAIGSTIIWAARTAADIFASTGRYQEAADVMEDLLVRAETIDPEELSNLGVALRDYGDILNAMPGNAQKAERILRRAQVILDPGWEDPDPDGVYVNVMTSLADALSAQGLFEEARDIRAKFGDS